MRICLDARKIADFGIGQYIQNLLPALSRLEDAFELHLILPNPASRELVPADRRIQCSFLATPTYSPVEQVTVPWRVSRVKPDVLHVPHYNAPLLCQTPMICTVHDLIHLRFRGQLPSTIARAYAWFMFRAVVRRCARVIAISRCTRRDLIQIVGARPDRLHVIHYGLDPRFMAGPSPTPLPIPGVKDSEKVLLIVGNCKPHKNVELVLDALSRMQRACDFKLVIAGGDEASIARLRSHAAWRKVETHLVFLGNVPHDRISDLYVRATALAFPSLYEGFGLPPLEAMAAKCPVLASTAASIPEVVGEAALMLNPTNPEVWREAIERIMDDDGLREDLSRMGFDRAQTFSWDRAARETFALYREISGRNAPCG